MSRDEIQVLYEEWRHSGETQAVFLRGKKHKPSLFKDNYKSLDRDFNKKKPIMAQMLPVQVRSKAKEPMHSPKELVYHFLDGESLRFPSDVSIEYLSKLIGTLNSRRPC